jgi:hypothetical protein
MGTQRVKTWLIPVVVGLGLGVTPMIEARPQDVRDALIADSEADSLGERLEALGQLARRKDVRPVEARRIAARLSGLRASDREAVLRLEALERQRDPEVAQTVARWVVAAAAEAPGERDRRAWQRALGASVAAMGAGSGETVEGALLALARLDDVTIARAALASAAGREHFDAGRHVGALVAMLARPDLECLSAVLALLGRTNAADAVEPIIAAMERYAEANPRRGAPEHARALQRLTGQSLGDAPAEWRAWWNRRRHE